MGKAIFRTFRPRTLPSTPSPPSRRTSRRERRVRVTAEKTSQQIMPRTMRPTARSGVCGRNRHSSPSTAPARMSCSMTSVKAGG